MECWQVLYTKQLTKKHKKFLDGYLIIQANHTAVLLDAEGAVLDSTRLPSTTPAVSTDTQEATWFEGLLVNVDGPCTPQDLPKSSGAAAACAPPNYMPAPGPLHSDQCRPPAGVPSRLVRPSSASTGGSSSWALQLSGRYPTALWRVCLYATPMCHP